MKGTCTFTFGDCTISVIQEHDHQPADATGHVAPRVGKLTPEQWIALITAIAQIFAGFSAEPSKRVDKPGGALAR